MHPKKSLEILIISGLSGAGKSSVAGVLEDFGYCCVDNLPPSLIPHFVEVCQATEGRISRVGIVVDIRGLLFFGQLKNALDSLREMGCRYKVLFLTATEDTLINRFKETRRRHPLTSEGSVLSDIRQEAKIMEEFRSQADWVIDTSSFKLRDLKEKMKDLFFEKDCDTELTVVLTSFGYKKGIPLDADLLFDIRFLPNPYYEGSLKDLKGTDPEVKQFVLENEIAGEFLDKLLDLLNLLLPQYHQEGKVHLSIGVGCTGGRHRSVAVVEELRKYLKQQKIRLFVRHRDLEE
ncbi:MAG: RNase adapter RapZ [bacterium]|jgi:UPF0042 nucleotide-binding protein|nr:RNase adapter RapZ [bacterium]